MRGGHVSFSNIFLFHLLLKKYKSKMSVTLEPVQTEIAEEAEPIAEPIAEEIAEIENQSQKLKINRTSCRN